MMQKSLATNKETETTGKKLAKVVIAGRPNVGKSTLFNRLIGRKDAIVDSTAGVTRDSKLIKAKIGELNFELVDTAGIETDESGIAGRLNELAETAIKQADLVLFMLDGKDGITAEDEDLSRRVRAFNKPTIPIVNKTDVIASEDVMYEIYNLGFDGAVGISSAHGRGMEDLEEAIRPILEEFDEKHKVFGYEPEDEDKPLPLAIVGRPNAGKSTLVNALLESKRMLTGPEAGLTRESVGTLWKYDDELIELVDTPGIRKKAKVNEKLEQMSVTNAMGAIARSEFVILMLDATCPFEKQDSTLAGRAVDLGKPLLIVLNKWDLVEEKEETLEEVRYLLDTQFSQVKNVPLITISALNDEGLDKIMPEVFKYHAKWQTRLSTAPLNRFLEGMTEENPHPMRKGRRIKIKYMTQTDVEPPTFVLWCNVAKHVQDSYIRFILNGLRKAFDLDGVVIKMEAKSTKNPYAPKTKS